ncbi:hypothetical protein [Rivularia sp. UHCC 0363]|nr:hypothetical protein [Rivularia sp. UHCC 0363]MEA5593439.1 hypothetical protein [Rivularia sp. UHCC 0363]
MKRSCGSSLDFAITSLRDRAVNNDNYSTGHDITIHILRDKMAFVKNN